MEKNVYDVDQKVKMGFSPQQFTEYQTIFKSLDENKDGFINKTELFTAMHNMGYRTIKEEDVDKLIAEVDLNDNKVIEFSEFLAMMKNFITTGKENIFTKVVTKTGQNIFRVGGGDSMSYSSFSEEERSAFAKVINTVLRDDEVSKKYIPVDPDTMDLFKILKNGIILCKLINKAQPGTIDERVINVKDNMNVFNMIENLKLGLNSAKSIGCQIISVYAETFIEENAVQILGILWQIIKQIVLGELNLKNHPQLIRLLKEGEQVSDLLRANPEELLLRWFNYHLVNAGYDKRIANFSNDIKDSEKYVILLNQLNKEVCDKSPLNESDLAVRAAKVLENARNIGVDSFITVKDICNGNNKLNILFTAAIFNTCHGLDPPNEEEYEAAKLLEDDAEGSREERAYRMWINSLGIENVYINNLYEDSKSGVNLLKIIDKVKPGTVNWKKVDEKATNKFKKMENCCEAVDASKKAGFTIVGIGGTDILSGNKKLILAIVWQVMRAHTLQVIGGKTEDEILKWANEMVNKETQVKTFKDKTLKDSLFFIDLMNAMEPRAINWDLVMKDGSPEAVENNAKYAISISRKLGATVFLVWEDIQSVKSNMLMTFVAALYNAYFEELKAKGGKK